MTRSLVISLPDAVLLDRVSALLPDDEIILWDLVGPAPRDDIDIVVPGYMSARDRLARLATTRARLVQSQSIGYDGVVDALPPDQVFANAASVHEPSTAELALALILALQRGIPDFVRAQDTGHWAHQRLESLADRTVLIVGYGGVGVAIEERLRPFEVNVLRTATKARVSPLGPVHAASAIPELLPEADIVVLAVPLSPETRHLADAAFMRRMHDGAMLVNISRGPVVDTDALLTELRSGRLRAGLDVIDPEPLPDGHPLWSAPNLLISPHVGGATSAMAPRMAALIARQAELLRAGQEPINVVVRS